MVEDLTGVLERIASRTGTNGPQGPVTQWMLMQAAEKLATQLARDIRPGQMADSVPKVLSALIGHEPFVRQTLGLSVHQLLRRWPQASDWYYDLIAYVMRPQRYVRNAEAVSGHVAMWSGMSLGEMTRAFSEFQMAESRDPSLYALADVISTLWPEHPQVQASHDRAQRAVFESFGALYELILPTYGLRLRPGVTLHEVVWTLQAVASWDMREESLRPVPSRRRDPVDGAERPHHSRAAMVFLAGAVEGLDGRYLSHTELYGLFPVRP